MKKIIACLMVLAAIGIAAVLLIERPDRSKLGAMEIAPIESVAFIHLPDLRRSAKRWPGTALAKIAREPEVAAFLERPRTKSAHIATIERVLAQFARVKPGEAFVASTSLDDSLPKMLAGFSFAGSSGDLDRLLAQPRAAIRAQWPGGKEERSEHAGARLALYRTNDFIFCETVHRGWYLAATQLDLLQGAVERLSGRGPAERRLARSDGFRASRATLPGECELNFYANIETLAYRIAPMLAAAGVTLSPEQLTALKRVKSFTYGLKIVESQFHETAFLFGPGSAAPAPLSMSALPLSSPATSLFYTGRIPTATPPEFASPLLALLPGMGSFHKSVVEAGFKPEELGRVLGKEFAMFLDWPAEAATPSFAFTFELADAVRVRQLADTVLAQSRNSEEWKRTEHRGAALLSQPGTSLLLMMQPTIAIADRFALVGLSPEGVMGFLDRGAAPGARLDAVPEFQRAAKLLNPPGTSFAYLDLATIVSRTYGTFRPLLAMTIALQPGGSGMIDAGKLPSATVISRHLTPVVFSSGETETGFRMESAGPISLTQLALAVGGFSFSSGASGWLGKMLPGSPLVPRANPQSSGIGGQKKPDPTPGSDAPAKANGSTVQPLPSVERGPPRSVPDVPENP